MGSQDGAENHGHCPQATCQRRWTRRVPWGRVEATVGCVEATVGCVEATGGYVQALVGCVEATAGCVEASVGCVQETQEMTI